MSATIAPQPGDTVEFLGYSDPGITDELKIFQPGQMLRIDRFEGDEGGMVAVLLDADGNPTDTADTVFPEELKSDAPVAESQAPAVVEPAPAAKGGKGGKGAKGAKGAAKAAPKAVEEAAPPPVKTKAEIAAEAKAAKEAEKAAAKAAAKAAKDAEKAVKDAEKAAVQAPAQAPAAAAEITPAVVRPAASPAAVEFEDTVEVKEALRMHNDALQAAKSLVQQTERTYYALGGVLAHIYKEGIHKTAGFDGKRGFADYVNKELGIDYRKAMYLIDIYNAFAALGVQGDRLAAIGWSKAKELTKVVTPENLDSILEQAETRSREDLIEYVRTEFVQAGDGTTGTRVARTTLTFKLFADQAETVQRAIREATMQAGENATPEQALEHICGEWMMASEGVESTVEMEIARIKAKFGLHEIVVSYPSGETLSTNEQGDEHELEAGE